MDTETFAYYVEANFNKFRIKNTEECLKIVKHSS
jgi:hypothetical protein